DNGKRLHRDHSVVPAVPKLQHAASIKSTPGIYEKFDCRKDVLSRPKIQCYVSSRPAADRKRRRFSSISARRASFRSGSQSRTGTGCSRATIAKNREADEASRSYYLTKRRLA